MDESGIINPQLLVERNKHYDYETTKVDGIIYDVRKLEAAAEAIPIQEVTTESLRPIMAQGRHYWLDSNGQSFGPADILNNWEAAKANPAWKEHVATIDRANLNRPSWLTKDGEVFNGLHRLTRAFRDNIPTVKVRIWENLPEEAKVQEP